MLQGNSKEQELADLQREGDLGAREGRDRARGGNVYQLAVYAGLRQSPAGASSFLAPQARPDLESFVGYSAPGATEKEESVFRRVAAASPMVPITVHAPAKGSPFAYRISGTVKALIRLQQVFGTSSEQMATLLGYNEVEEWNAIKDGHSPLDLSPDRQERIRTLLSIHGLLDALYQSEPPIAAWLQDRLEQFDRSAIDQMLRGRMRDLYIVADYLRGITG
jgi:hypothetical protein